MDQRLTIIEDVQKVINTLQKLQIQATYENLSCLGGSIAKLVDIRTQLEQMPSISEVKENQNGIGNE